LTWAEDRTATLPLPTPDGTVAFAIVQRRRDQEVRDRRGRKRVRRALVTSSGRPAGPGLADSEAGWVLASPVRRATSIAARLPDASGTAERLCRAGVVDLVYDVTEDFRLGALLEWRLTPEWKARSADGLAAAKSLRGAQSEAAVRTAEKVKDLSPELASALRAVPPGGEAWSPLAALTAAAQDLLDGCLHDGPRAFSQRHFGDGKVRDDIARLLTDQAVPVDVADAIGVRRSPRVGLSGPVVVRAPTVAPLELTGWDGPLVLRADQPGLSVTPASEALTLVVVENAQSAEWVSDQHPEAIVLYTAGPLSPPGLRILAECSALAARTIVVCDADLGGVRISNQIVTAAPAAEIIDIGRWPHTPGTVIEAGGVTDAGLRRALEGPVGRFAASILDRGYRVEQEQPTTAALRELLAVRT